MIVKKLTICDPGPAIVFLKYIKNRLTFFKKSFIIHTEKQKKERE